MSRRTVGKHTWHALFALMPKKARSQTTFITKIATIALKSLSTQRVTPSAMTACLLLCSAPARRSLDERVGEEQHQGDNQAVDSQRLHEGQGEQQHAAQVIGHLRLAADAIDAAARGDALANAGAD